MKKNAGITLIALIITVIVLLILAGVAIVTLTGENSLLERANKAIEETKIKEAEEIIKLIIYENRIAENQNEYSENNQLIEKIVNKLKDEGYIIEADNDTVIYGKEKIKISDYIERDVAQRIIINAPKNSITTLKLVGKEVGNIEMNSENQTTGSIDIYRKLGEQVTAICKLNNEVIYEKNFGLQQNNNINMYPCEENGDGKALYWYGMEFADFQSGKVTYGTIVMKNLGNYQKKENNLNLQFNDTSNSEAYGIGINCKQNLTNYNNIQIKVENLIYTGFGITYYIVGNTGNDYSNIDVGIMEDIVGDSGTIISNEPKNLNISDISGEKYISILNFNPSGAGSESKACGSISMDIPSIVLKK